MPRRHPSRFAAGARLVAVAGGSAAAFGAALTRLPSDPVDWSDPTGWLARTDPETAALALGRLVVLTGSGWLAVVVTLQVVAALTIRRPPRGLLHRVTPALVRRSVEAMVAASLVTGAAGPRAALAGEPGPPPLPREPVAALGAPEPIPPLRALRDGRATPATATVAPDPATPVTPDPTTVGTLPRPRPTVVVTTPAPPPTAAPRAPVESRPATSPPPLAPVAPRGPGPAPGPAPEPVDAGPAGAPARHVVTPGEHLWSIARDHLVAQGRPADLLAVDRYWRAVCDANRAGLTSGDVNLVHPGETVDLPPVA